MISQKKLVKLANKWEKIAVMRKRIGFPGTINRNRNTYSSTKSILADEGHFVVYTTDDQRLVIPLKYLRNNIIGELLKMSEEVYGLPSEGPIKLPYDAVFMNYVVSVIQIGLDKFMEKALLASLGTRCCHSSSSDLREPRIGQQVLVCS